MKITASIVTYNNNYEELNKAMVSLLYINNLKKIYISDNSYNENIKSWFNDERIIYFHNRKNIGFGAAHNIAIKKAIDYNSDYHIVANPDVYFNKGNVEKIINYMENNIDIGLSMPKILYPDGQIQYVCKLLPTPFDLFIRVLLNKYNLKMFKKHNEIFEMRFTKYDHVINVPYISGCFMIFRTKVLKEIGFFDENIFMYLEDADITRRILRKYKTIMIPEAFVYHKWNKGTYKSFKLKLITIKSAIYYFNKYGWFIDKERKYINERIKNE